MQNMGDYIVLLANFILWACQSIKQTIICLFYQAGGGLMNGMAYDELNGNDSF